MTGRTAPFSVSRRMTYAAVVTLLAIAYVVAGIYAVPTTSVAVTRLLGVVTGSAVPPGVHWWWPSPIGRVDRVEVTRTFSMPIGYFALDQVSGTPPDPSVSRWLTGDTNIIQIRARVNFRVGDPVRWLLTNARPAELVRYLAGSAFTEITSGVGVDEMLTSGRLAVIDRVRDRVQQLLDRWSIGVIVLAVNLESVEPPPDVVAAFQDVQNARADRDRMISQAETYANGVLPVARGEAEQTNSRVLGWRDERLGKARGDAARFAALEAEHRRSPALLERRLYLETAERVLPRVRRYVLSPDPHGATPLRIIQPAQP